MKQRRHRVASTRGRKTAKPKRSPPIIARRDNLSVADLRAQTRELTRELGEARDQLTAASGVLRVISDSPADLQSALGAIAESAARLLDVVGAEISRVEGDGLRLMAKHGSLPQRLVGTIRPINRNWVTGRAVVDRTTVQVLDLQAAEAEFPEGAASARKFGHRTTLATPLLREGNPIGAILIRRMDVRPFTDKQIALLQNFATQAVIAIENARLLSELRQSLQQQTATADVLKVISRSTFDLKAVLNTLVASAARLCEADMASIPRVTGASFDVVATYGYSPDFQEFLRRNPTSPGRGTISGRAVLEGRTVHIPDVLADPEYDYGGGQGQKVGGFRTLLGVPLLREGLAIGALVLARSLARPFTSQQIDLATTFADQAMIAIENVRLFEAEQLRTRELSESLEQQTATSEVLRVISSSRGDLEPVFQAILENATRICEASFGNLLLREGDTFRRVATHNAPQRYAAFHAKEPLIHRRQSLSLNRLIETQQADHVVDMAVDDPETPIVKFGGARTLLSVPMLKENTLIGAIGIYRQEVRPFTDKQIELVNNFASQAVIAIENARLLNELRESLDHQTATADILRVIASTPEDSKRALDTIAETAVRMFNATNVNFRRLENNVLRVIGAAGPASTKVREVLPDFPLESTDPAVRSVFENRQIHIEDRHAILPTERGEIARVLRDLPLRTQAFTPLLRQGEAIGVMIVTRGEVRSFQQVELDLMTGFADQAVIAIENARLLNELRESLQQQTATSEILDVISNSPTDSQPAFEAIVRSGLRLFPNAAIMIGLPDGKFVTGAAIADANPAGAAALRARLPLPLSREFITSAAILDRREIDLADARDAPPEMAAGARNFLASGYRAITVMPMMRGDTAIGAVNVMHRQPVQLSEKQRELLRTFANQAVIAIENTRLFSELRQRTDDLTESLEQQTATVDVLRVISNSPTNVQPVFNSIAESAVRLCSGQFSFVIRFDGKAMNFASCFGLNTEGLDVFRSLFPRPASDDTVSGRAILQRAVVEVSDVEADPAYGMQSQRLARTVNYRSIVGVPLLHEGNPIGAFAVARANPGAFPVRQIALLQAFADQAVIAIRNVRLFDEVQARTEELTESLDQQTATAEVLKVISRSAFDLQPVFDTMAENAVKLCEAERAFIFRFDGKLLRAVATYNVGPEAREFVDRNPIVPGRHSVSARAALERRTVQVPDVQADPEYAYAARDTELIRTVLAVPMLKGDDLVGTITIFRLEVKPFTDKQVALVETFAAQAVIAIENTRLLNELRESLQQQTATADVLKALSRSTFDLNTVLQTLVEAAARLCEADQGTIAREQDGVFVRAATYGFSAEFTDYVTHLPVERERGSATGRALLEGRTVHIPDVQSDPDYTFSKAKELGGFRTILAVPMLRDGAAIGVLALTRIDVHPFSEKQIDLVTTFADQAAIAIENVRLFESAEARTRELAKSLEELRTAQDRLVQTQKLASLGQLTAGIAHEIKNPLNFVNNFSGVSAELVDELKQALERVTTDGQTQAELTELIDTLHGNLAKIVQHGKRADSIVKNMLLHSREGSGEHRPVDINVVVEESLNLAYHGARAEKQGFNIKLERSFDPAAGEVDLFPQEMTRVFLNLISNGFYAATKRKAEGNDETYEPILSAATKNLGDRVEIRIRDNGIGIPPEVRERMFNPFFTTKPVGEGTGLGLSISHDIVVKQHAGVIEVESRPGEFTEFRIVLPRTAAFIVKTGGRA